MQISPYESQLKELWAEGQRSIGIKFLRSVMRHDATLADIAAALQFQAVRDFLVSIRLHEVLEPKTGASPAARAEDGATPGAPATAARPMPAPKARRRRRGPDEMDEIRDHLWSMLQKEPGSLNTTQLHEGLAALGHDVDRITLKRLLCQLQDDNKVTCLGGRPKAWRQRVQQAAQR
jgi:hypothetical protein